MGNTTTTLGAITPGEWFTSSFQVWARTDGKKYGTLIASLRTTGTTDTAAQADEELIADAGNTAQKTGKLPSQLLQERDELVGALREAEERAQELSDLLSKGTYTEGSITDQYMKRLLSTLKYPKS